MDLPDILVVAEKLGLPLHSIQGGRQYETPCWACSDRLSPDKSKHGHLTIIPSKQTFRCPRCDYHGNVWTMARDLLGKTAGDKFIKDMSFTPQILKAKSVPVIEETPAANIEVRDKVYDALLKKLVLAPRHFDDLLDRGMPGDYINEKGYKSTPGRESTEGIAFWLAKEGYPLENIPGFYKNKQGKWDLVTIPGFYIPVKDELGRVQGLQIRVNNEYLGYINRRYPDTKLRKYMWLSSVAKKDGCSSGSPVHIANTYSKNFQRIGITEGPIKADIASFYTGIPVMGIAGTGLFRAAAQTAKDLKNNESLIFYDSDKKFNINVKEHEKALLEELKNYGIKGITYSWDLDLGKGIDDVLTNVAHGHIPIDRELFNSVIKIDNANYEILVQTTVKIKIKGANKCVNTLIKKGTR